MSGNGHGMANLIVSKIEQRWMAHPVARKRGKTAGRSLDAQRRRRAQRDGSDAGIPWTEPGL